MTRTPLGLFAMACVLLLSACGEKPQVAGTARKADGKVWQSDYQGFDAAGYKPADKHAWDEQIRARSVGQNEYAKTR